MPGCPGTRCSRRNWPARYKPDLEVYRKAADLLGLAPGEVMMVAAHKGDLRAAAAAGLRTAFVPRPRERPNRDIDLSYDDAFDVNARDFLDLADPTRSVGRIDWRGG